MKKTLFLPQEVESFQIQGSNHYQNILQIMQEDVQKIDHQIREINNKKAGIEQNIVQLEELLRIEKKDIHLHMTDLNKALKSLQKTKETLPQRKELKKEKDTILLRSRELKIQITRVLPQQIQALQEDCISLQKEKETLLKDIQKVATNPVAFCQTMKDKISAILSEQSFSESRLPISKELEKQSRFYSKAVLEALKVAALPINEARFNIVGKGPSEGKIKSSFIPNNSDFGTYNDGGFFR